MFFARPTNKIKTLWVCAQIFPVILLVQGIYQYNIVHQRKKKHYYSESIVFINRKIIPLRMAAVRILFVIDRRGMQTKCLFDICSCIIIYILLSMLRPSKPFRYYWKLETVPVFYCPLRVWKVYMTSFIDINIVFSFFDIGLTLF